MTVFQIVALSLMAVFYAVYIGKMLIQRRQGIRTDVLGTASKPRKERAVETALKIVTYSVVAVEIGSIAVDRSFLPNRYVWAWIGMAVAAVGVTFFVAAVATMRDSWRAGISPEEKTALVTNGIYRISRNPAFVGFDLMYIGIFLAFPNVVHLVFVAVAIVLFHLQILQEERFMLSREDVDYAEYMERTRRYI